MAKFVIVYELKGKDIYSRIIEARDMDEALDRLTRKKEFEDGYYILLASKIA